MDLRKVYGGTPVGQASQCDTCVYARIIRGYSESEKITLCDRLLEVIRIPFRVRECTDYVDKRLPCVEDLEDIAWLLRSKSAGKKAGFVAVNELRDSQVAEEQSQELPEEIPEVIPEDVPEEVPEQMPAATAARK
ncbi:MAG: hypothetical protein LAO20_10385 [Acidobacteriia bacterium]|nr:hypothetical protein [Terriglobia bacterium]